MTLPHHPTRRAGFTLVELMVVLVIIMILVGMVAVGIQMLKANSMRKKAATHAQSLLHAVKSYKAVYGKWPLQSQNTEDTIYSGTNQASVINALTNNPRRIELIEIPFEALTENALTDPWDRNFVIVMDEDNDGLAELNVTLNSTTYATNVKESAIIFSWGQDPKDEDGYVRTWQ